MVLISAYIANSFCCNVYNTAINKAGVVIVSISLNKQMVDEIARLQKEMGFSGRSETIRAGVRSFAAEEKQKSEMAGDINAVLLVLHRDEFDSVVSDIRQGFEDLVTMHLHSKIEGDKCMELFVVAGDSQRISDITRRFRTNDNMDTVKLVML